MVAFLIISAARTGDCFVGFAFCFFLFFGFAAIVKLLSFRHGYLTFRNPVPEINFGRDDRHALLLGLNQEAIDLPAIQKELSFSKGLVIPAAAGQVFRDVTVDQPNLATANLGEGFAKGAFPLPEGLDLGTYQDNSGLKTVQKLVVIGRGPVLRNNLDAGVLVLICTRFRHKSIICAATEFPQVLALERVPVWTGDCNKIVV